MSIIVKNKSKIPICIMKSTSTFIMLTQSRNLVRRSSFFHTELINLDPVNGECSEWTAWTQCSTHGGSLRFRTRTCTNPTPAFDGLDCNGSNNMTELYPLSYASK